MKGIADLRQKYLIGKAYHGKGSEEKLYRLYSFRPLKYFKGMSIDFLMVFWWLKYIYANHSLLGQGELIYALEHVLVHCFLCEVEL